MTDDQILSEDIKIAPFSMTQLLEFELEQHVNEHIKLSFRAVIGEKEAESYLEQLDSNTQITASRQSEEGERAVLFIGYLQDIQISNVDHVYYLKVTAVSATYLLDVEKKSRSFQDTKMTYQSLISQILKDYQQPAYVDALSNDQPIGHLIVQYRETDWEFLKRLAAGLGGVLLSVCKNAAPRFYFGYPERDSMADVNAFNFDFIKDIKEYNYLTENTDYQFPVNHYNSYYVETLQLFQLADRVSYQNNAWYVGEASCCLEKGMLVSRYLLITKERGIVSPLYNHQLIGLSLKGTVTAVKSDKVLVDLDIDRSTGSRGSYWFIYSTAYTSDNNIGWYMMPEIGDRVRVYFPDAEEKNAYALASVRDEKGQESYLDPEVKTLKNKYGKTITLEPDKITIFSDQVQLTLSDSEGIVIKSSSSVLVNTSKKIQIHGNEILMDASETIKMSVNSNSITMNDRIVLNGTEVKMN